MSCLTGSQKQGASSQAGECSGAWGRPELPLKKIMYGPFCPCTQPIHQSIFIWVLKIFFSPSKLYFSPFTIFRCLRLTSGKEGGGDNYVQYTSTVFFYICPLSYSVSYDRFLREVCSAPFPVVPVADAAVKVDFHRWASPFIPFADG